MTSSADLFVADLVRTEQDLVEKLGE